MAGFRTRSTETNTVPVNGPIKCHAWHGLAFAIAGCGAQIINIARAEFIRNQLWPDAMLLFLVSHFSASFALTGLL